MWDIASVDVVVDLMTRNHGQFAVNDKADVSLYLSFVLTQPIAYIHNAIYARCAFA